MSKPIRAYILGKINPGSEKTVAETIKTIKGVKSIELTFGQYDLVATIEADNEANLKEIVIDSVRKIPSLKTTVTLISPKLN